MSSSIYVAKATSTRVQVSISPIFYEQLFHSKVFCAAFMCLQFGFVIFWQKDFGAKAAHKILVKLTSALLGARLVRELEIHLVVYFLNIG
jgi:hypothetical protein